MYSFPIFCVALYVYFGSTAHTLADILNGKVGKNIYLTIGILVLSGILIVIVITVITIIGKRALGQAIKEQEEQKKGMSVGNFLTAYETDTLDFSDEESANAVFVNNHSAPVSEDAYPEKSNAKSVQDIS